MTESNPQESECCQNLAWLCFKAIFSSAYEQPLTWYPVQKFWFFTVPLADTHSENVLNQLGEELTLALQDASAALDCAAVALGMEWR